jgi:hypothetical protein
MSKKLTEEERLISLEKRRIYCRDYNREYRKSHRERIAQREREYTKRKIQENSNFTKEKYYRVRERANNDYNSFVNHVFIRSKSCAKKRNIGWFISKEEFRNIFLASKTCRLSGITLVPQISHPHRPSLDRIDSSKDYTIDNVQLVSARVNVAKNNQHSIEFIEMCRMVVEHNGGT